MTQNTETHTRERLRGMLLLEAMYPVLAPALVDTYKERPLMDRMRTAAIVGSVTLLNRPIRVPVDLSVLEAVHLAVKRGRG